MNTFYAVEPLGNWTEPVTDPRPYCRFRAHWYDTLRLLDDELRNLDAAGVVLQVDVERGEIRRDGMLRANARVRFPGVRISFTSRFGPLTYATDRYDDWQDNVRAIALSLQALRAVDRYGVNRRGEQYSGWLQLEAKPAPMTALRADAILASYGGERAALKATHPDTGGSAEAFAEVQAARAALNGGRL